MGDVAGLVLAAGAGRRYGMPKALVPYQGRLLVERATATVRAGGCAPVTVVLGAAAAEVTAAADLGDAAIVVNDDWDSGMGSSLRRGLAHLATGTAAAALVLLVDLPGVTPAAVRRVVASVPADRLGAALAAATFRGRQGHPVLIGRWHWPAVAERAVADRGARDYLAEQAVTLVPCDDVAIGEDLDHPPGPGTTP